MAYHHDAQRRYSLTGGAPPVSFPGWKARRFGDFMEGRLPQPVHVKRWDGATRTAEDWDCLRRDPELWFRNGNCLVHLYGQGQSRRGPAFKVPFSALLASGCHPLVERFIISNAIPATPGAEVDRYRSFELWSELNPNRRVELYIPAPPGADRNQSFQYHLATRNLFAWIFRRSVVGEHLGGSLRCLFGSLQEFRLPGEDNLDALMRYMDEEGYLDMGGQPNHALAMLHLAESLQIRDLYINAFAHCAGMSNRLFLSSEYQSTSSVSRKLVRRARAEMDLRLGQASTMLRSFLEDELSEAHLGLSAAARAHLERFRSFLLAFYASKLGYYPPASIDSRSTIFDAYIYRTMHDDFRALYELLVDEAFRSDGGVATPPLAQGGICAVQSVQSFDLRFRYRGLEHPLPLLPEVASASKSSRRLSWVPRLRDKLRPENKLVAHAALIKATNTPAGGGVANELVRAYRRFEEESVASGRVDRSEKIGLVDARKVRWILVYCVYQVLRNIITSPPEVRDADGIDYTVSITTDGLPPWKEMTALSRGSSRLTRSNTSRSTAAGTVATATTDRQAVVSGIESSISKFASELRPDIDYLGLQRASGSIRTDERPATSGSLRAGSAGRTMSLTRTLSATGGAFRRSLSVFRRDSTASTSGDAPLAGQATAQKDGAFHEIVVHGYGNGTNIVSFGDGENKPDIDDEQPSGNPAATTTTTTTANRTLSTSSNSSNESGGSLQSKGSSAGTADSTLPPTSPRDEIKGPSLGVEMESRTPPIPARGRHREVVSYIQGSSRSRSSWTSLHEGSGLGVPSRPRSVQPATATDYARGYTALVEESFAEDDELVVAQPKPKMAMARYEWEDDEGIVDRQVQDEWEHYTGLGGHTPMLPVVAA